MRSTSARSSTPRDCAWGIYAVSPLTELHDVGKMAIPDAIFDKPGPLDAEEWRSCAGTRSSASGSWDRGGYPDGLAGEKIPVGISVCDAFDAMITDRPYRRAMSEGAALAELRRCSGSQFDPAAVEAFSRVLRGALVAAS